MSRPDTTRPTGKKTLYEVAAERQAQLAAHGQPFRKSNSNESVPETRYVKLTPQGEITGLSSPWVEEEEEDSETETTINPILDTLFLALPLSFLHFTLAVLTAHQYAQELKFAPIILSTVFTAFPTLALLIHLVHGHLLSRPAHALLPDRVKGAVEVGQQLLFLLVANVAGCYLIHVTNDRGYYAVMKKAPSIGTVWVWSVLELGLTGALAGVVGPGLFAWWKGYEIL